MKSRKWSPLATGGYASVFISPCRKEVCKVMPKYIEERGEMVMNTNAIHDLCVQCSFRDHIRGISQLSSYTVNDDCVEMCMPYYGSTLNHHKIPKNKIIHVATKLLEILIQLYKNNVQHTDLKPCNIIVSKDYDVTVIDFNNISLRTSIDDASMWTSGYGTWHYCPPEVIYHLQPTDASMVWSFALLLAYMYQKYPLLDLAQCESHKLASRSFWKYQINIQRHKLPDGPVLPPKHVVAMPMDLIILFHKCMKWDPSHRMSLESLYVDLTGSIYSRYNVKNVATRDVVEEDVACLLSACKATDTMYAFERALYIFSKVNNNKQDNQLCAAHALSIILIGNYEQTKNDLVKYWKVQDTKTIEDAVWALGECVQWDVLGCMQPYLRKV